MDETEESVIQGKLLEWDNFLKGQGISRNERRFEAKKMRKDLEAINKNLRKTLKEKVND